ncbi:MAG: DUF1501 domain-containing protein [Planctomycetaceae bacterium]|nr:DUF1501 domain-containing protein [Planctomycetaceae bacterium]
MLKLMHPSARLCDGVSRREMLRAGGLGLMGLSLSKLLAAQARGAAEGSSKGGRAKSCIVLFLMGGPPQHSTWDPKPDAPAEVRGEIGPIATKLPGVQFGALMPKLAGMADRLAILRAVSTGDNAHSSSGYYMMTGRPHAPMNFENANPGPPNDWPNIGSVVARLTTPRSELPRTVRLPCHIYNTDGSVWPGQTGGFLGRSADPWLFRCEPASPDFKIPEFSLPIDVPTERLTTRRSLLGELNQKLATAERSGKLEEYDGLTQRAFGLLSSPQARRAFDLAAEPDSVRQQYGMSQFGQSCLLSRRLIEAGVRLVQVNWFRGPDEPSDNPCWDSHTNETQRLKEVLIPPMDSAFSALVTDLAQRGLLDETLVVCLSEFGRTPRFNARGGRDHWGSVFSIALAGGGTGGGVVHGASDKLAAYPQDGLVKPEDITATIFHCLGISPESEIHDSLGRPFTISRGQVLEPILT